MKILISGASNEKNETDDCATGIFGVGGRSHNSVLFADVERFSVVNFLSRLRDL